MRAADHRRTPMLFGARVHRLHQAVETLQDQVAGFAHLQRLRGVDDVGRRQAEMQPARGRADVLGDGGREGDDVVLRDLFDVFDARDVEGAALANVAAASAGTMPARAIASTAATSTCSQVSYFRWSLQMRPISGWVYRGSSIPKPSANRVPAFLAESAGR